MIKKLDYIYTTGCSLIDFGIKCKSSLKIQIGLNMTSATGQAIIGAPVWLGERDAFRFFNVNQKAYLDWGSGQNLNRISGGSLLLNTKYNIEIGNRYVKNLDSDTYFCQAGAVGDFEKTYNLTLCGNNADCAGYFYYVKVYDCETLIFDGLPALDEENNVGLYDQVSKSFFANTGNTAFTYGAVIGVFSDNIYLIQDTNTIYTVTNDVLEDLETTEITAELFQTHGIEEPPTSEILLTLTNPKVLVWSDEEQQELTATITATPYPQTIYSPGYDMTDPTILGIEKVIAVASEDVMFAVSFDSGETWKHYTGTEWATLSEETSGMSAETIMSVPTDKWSEVATTGTFKVRATLPSVESTLSSFVVDYLNA